MPDAATHSPRSIFSYWHGLPLYFRIGIGLILGTIVGLILRAVVAPDSPNAEATYSAVAIPSRIILRLLNALAPPLVLVAVVHTLLVSSLPKGAGPRLVGLLLLNTTVAIIIGLTMTNLIQPGRFMEAPTTEVTTVPEFSPQMLLDNIPSSLLGPFGDRHNTIGVIIIAVAFGIALRKQTKPELRGTVLSLVEAAFQALLTVLHWIIELVPLGVFCIIASTVAAKGFAPFVSLGAFTITVLLALSLQTIWYLIRIRWRSWVKPRNVLVGMRDALVMAFSTGSSSATMPLTYECLTKKVGLRERSASLGGLVGANFNNDGTALYEAMVAIFIAQLNHVSLGWYDQFLVVIMSIFASVGAAGIPEAGMVTLPLVLMAVKLPLDYIPLILTVDWFLDRCRTAVNVLGDVNVSCILDGKTPEANFDVALSNPST